MQADRNGDGALGTEELEKGMRPGHAGHVAFIMTTTVLLLLIFNAGGLARWTQDLPSTPTNIWLAERAADWHRVMTDLGPAAWFDALRTRVRGT
jgi:hypothetical protein